MARLGARIVARGRTPWVRACVIGLALLTTGCRPSIDWVLTPDQQGRLAFERGEPARAARLFQDRTWRGIAAYQAGDYAGAARALASVPSARAQFQYANALARLERLPEALAAYDRALAARPDFPEAAFNREWVQGLQDLAEKEYDDAGGTGGQLEADEIVFDERGARGQGEMTAPEARAQGLSETEMRDLWMRRVQTTPGDFLRLKFAVQALAEETP